MKKLLLILCIIFGGIYSFGTSFMEYSILEPTTNIIMSVVGLFGMLTTGVKFCKSI